MYWFSTFSKFIPLPPENPKCASAIHKQNKQNQKLKKKGKLAWKGQFEKWQGFFLYETGYQ